MPEKRLQKYKEKWGGRVKPGITVAKSMPDIEAGNAGMKFWIKFVAGLVQKGQFDICDYFDLTWAE